MGLCMRLFLCARLFLARVCTRVSVFIQYTSATSLWYSIHQVSVRVTEWVSGEISFRVSHSETADGNQAAEGDEVIPYNRADKESRC